jgi:retron-type reverse transcriptase
MNNFNVSVGGGLTSGTLFEHIISLENLFLAWREFSRGKRNKKDVELFEMALEDNLFQLHKELSSGTYRHGPYVSFYISDPKLRHIHKASVRDRVLHQAMFRVLYPIFDRSFIYDSFSSRINKGTHAGVARLEFFLRKASANFRLPAYALKCDIRKFFDSIDQTILRALIARKITDCRTIALIDIVINSFHVSSGKGLPLGNVTSQLFSNIYLNELDQFVKRTLRVKWYVRYCDDFVLVSHDREILEQFLEPIRSFLMEKLTLVLHERKIELRKYSQGIDFLGYVLRPHHRLLRTATCRRMIRLLREENLSSYAGTLSHCNGYKLWHNFMQGFPET